jgi:hypothetical protein
MEYHQSQDNDHLKVKLLGYCDKKVGEIIECIRSNRLRELRRMGGEYTVVFTLGNEVGIITSPIGAMQYFYYYDGRSFYHGEEVLDIMKKAGVGWEWDYESLGDLCDLENLTEKRTLHKRIKRVPPFSVLLYRDDLIIFERDLISTFKERVASPTEAVRILNDETYKWVSKFPFISLSGGFDSRVILSSMLKNDIFPSVVTVGEEESTDVKVARSITREYGLEHRVVQLTLDDLIDNGEKIAKITNGSKPTCHWNTYLYPKKAGIPKNESFYVGTLGEFARNYYFDKGIFALLLDGIPDLIGCKFWEKKILRHRTFRISELEMLSSSLKEQLDSNGVFNRAKRNSMLGKGGFLEGGARYYLEQRVPNFYANGIRMYNSWGDWRSPFHNVNWLEVIWNIDQRWKLGSNWHRLAIQRNWPGLMNFPEEKGFRKDIMLDKAIPFYWLPMMQRSKYKTYDLSDKWYKSKKVKEVLLDNSNKLSELVHPKLIENILIEHNERGGRKKAISFLLTLVYFCLAKSRF